METDQLRNAVVTISGRIYGSVTTQQGMQFSCRGLGKAIRGQGARSPDHFPLFSSAVADGMNMVTEELHQQNARRASLMNTVNRTCPQCGTALASNQSFCSNCGRRYTEGNIAQPTMPASSSNRYQSASSSNTTP